MRAESVVKPRLFEVDRVGDTAVVSLFDNIREGVTQEDEVGIVFEYDYYSIEIPFREGLESDVEYNYDKWLSIAMNETNKVEFSDKDRIDMLEDTILFILMGGM